MYIENRISITWGKVVFWLNSEMMMIYDNDFVGSMDGWMVGWEFTILNRALKGILNLRKLKKKKKNFFKVKVNFFEF